MKVVEFFTFPPIPYPYILTNIFNPRIKMIKKFKNEVKKIIIDAGIEIFRNPNTKDYPPNHIQNVVRIYKQFVNEFPNTIIYAVAPDYCDDYHPKGLWLNEKTNIERTVENVIQCSKYTDVNWIIPIQGWNRQPESVLKCIEYYRENGIIDKYDYFAVANLCVERKSKIIYDTVRIVRSQLQTNKRLHVFGLSLRAFKIVQYYIDSFDSFAWTRPVDSSLKANYSCKTTEERKRFFMRWLEKYNLYMNLNQPKIDKWLM